MGPRSQRKTQVPTIELTLPPDTDSPRRARRFLQDALDARAPEGVLDVATLLLSEVVTNAVLHARTEVRVAVSWVADRLRVEVADASPLAPTPRNFSEDAGTGRGMLLVAELADDWGTQPAEPGKVVWFELAAA